VIIADTMGKGLPAGLLMSNVQGALRVLAEDINSPKELISKLNRWLCRNVPVTKFISLICLSLHANGNQQLVYTNAGHCPAILIRQNGKVEKLNPTGGVIGVHQEFEYEEKGMSILPGDLLLLYTDGIIEAQRTDGEMFGEQRMIEYITSRRNSNLYDLVDGLLGEVRSFSDRSEFEDDLTVISLRRTST
jgi:sigma-B regulation protein RsbU (phosphoserine phosphatase)